MSNQTEFISRIRSALGHEPDARRKVPELFAQQPSAESAALIDRIRQRGAGERRQLLARMVDVAKPLNLAVMAVADEAAATSAILELVRNKSAEWDNQTQVCAWQHPLVDALELRAAFESEGIPLYVVGSVPAQGGDDARAEIRRNIIASYIGITSADFVLADTATLVMRNRPGQPRSAAVVPSIHLAVVRLEQLLANLKELYTLLRWDQKEWESGLSNYMAFTSGPSKTADIEATMVHGAHGPREVHVYVIE